MWDEAFRSRMAAHNIMICPAARSTIHQASSVFQRAPLYFPAVINASHKLLIFEDNLLDRPGANPNDGGDGGGASFSCYEISYTSYNWA